jgi:hypothetical protein
MDGDLSRVVRAKGRRKAKSLPEPWPPAWAALPDTIEAIEAGRPGVQRSLFGPDDSREGRLGRIMGSGIPRGVTFSREFAGDSTRDGTF